MLWVFCGMIEINLLEWDGGQAELGLMLWISEHGEEKPFLPVSFLHLNLKEVILTFFSEEPREYFYQVPGDWGFFSWPESSLLVSRVSQHCYNLFPVKFLVINLKLQTLPYWVAVKLWKWSLSFRNLFQQLLFKKRPCSLHFIQSQAYYTK